MELTSIYPSSFSFLSAITRTRHDVFLSFRGEDTRYNITKQLHRALEEAGIPTFKDDVYLEKGGDIAIELLKAIQMSRIAVVVFSRNYADSRWCLDELVKIIECKNEAGQVVVPVFYDVDRGDVMQQNDVDRGDVMQPTNSYEKALHVHEEKFRLENTGDGRVDKWKSALTEAASSPYAVDLHETDESWNEFIKEIVKHIISRHQDAHMSATMFPPKKEAAKDYLNLLLSAVSGDILIIGVWGVDKTNTAKAVYNKNFARFRYSSFVSDVSAVAEQPDGLISLQKQFLSDILLDNNINISDVTAGTDMIKDALCNKRVLAVLDNVNKLDQLNALARNRDWFGAGSRVIITTKDPQLLNVLEVDDVYGTESIQVIEDQFRQNIKVIKGLMDYTRKFQAKALEREMSLIDEIEKEKKKNTIQEQAITELRGRIKQGNS